LPLAANSRTWSDRRQGPRADPRRCHRSISSRSPAGERI